MPWRARRSARSISMPGGGAGSPPPSAFPTRRTPMSNPFRSHSGGLNAPAARVVPIEPDDDTDLPGGVCRAILVGTGGTANLIDASGAERTGVPRQQGFNPIGAARVLTGGTASNLWALY